MHIHHHLHHLQSVHRFLNFWLVQSHYDMKLLSFRASHKLRWVGIIGSFGVSICLSAMPVQAQVSETQVGKTVEALRLAAPKTATKNDGLYSEWQVKPDTLARWSKQCTGRELSSTEFEANATAARSIVTCVIRDVLRDEYRASGNNEFMAVRRVAAWWMTGDAASYSKPAIAPYAEEVVSFYKWRTPAAATKPTPAINGSQTSVYDRYMKAGYAVDQQKDAATALLYFTRALDERPNDSFAMRAMQNAQASVDRTRGTAKPSPKPSTEPSPP